MRQMHNEYSERTPFASLQPLHRYDDDIDNDADNDDNDDDDDDDDDDDGVGSTGWQQLKPDLRHEARAADRLSMRLLEHGNDDSDEEDRILRESIFARQRSPQPSSTASLLSAAATYESTRSVRRRMSINLTLLQALHAQEQSKARRQFTLMVATVVLALAAIAVSLYIHAVIGPPNQPVGPYVLLERQEGREFFDYYTFYEGRDSIGSNGYNWYVNWQRAREIGIVNVSYETDILDSYRSNENRTNPRQWRQQRRLRDDNNNNSTTKPSTTKQPFVYLKSSPTPLGPRDSIRLEGQRRFNRGLFIIDVRHLPAGCGVWPAFWLTDEANWPLNGEIDIVEGVNYQSVAKTALHSTRDCSMEDIPLGTMTGTWDTAQGIPDAQTGVPDMTLRQAKNCFVYDPHQWLNQGCVAMDTAGNTLGIPLNDQGGGVFALEWDPINKHIRSWVFTPHSTVPPNLVDAIRTAARPDRVLPDPDTWPLPYGYFSIGDGTECAASHFREMRLVFNTAFCGSVAGNRFQLDCPRQAAQFATCNEYIQSEPDELLSAYWKIRGVYVYERAWERTFLK